jgi:hypothetical protein
LAVERLAERGDNLHVDFGHGRYLERPAKINKPVTGVRIWRNLYKRNRRFWCNG